jgi:hypothetical protein
LETGDFVDDNPDVVDANSESNVDIDEDLLEALDLGERAIDDDDLEDIATLTCRWEIQVSLQFRFYHSYHIVRNLAELRGTLR